MLRSPIDMVHLPCMQKSKSDKIETHPPEYEGLRRLRNVFGDEGLLTYITKSAPSLVLKLEKLSDEDPNWSEPCKDFLQWCEAELHDLHLTSEGRIRLFFKGRTPHLVSAIQNLNTSDFRRYILLLILNDEHPLPIDSFVDRIRTWSNWITTTSASHFLDSRSAHGQDLSRLFTGRLSWMRTLASLANNEHVIVSALEDATATRSFRVAMNSSSLGDGTYLLRDYANYSDRDTTPIYYESAAKTGGDNARELKTFLRASGFDILAKILVSGVTFLQVSEASTDGYFDHQTASIHLKERAYPRDRQQIPQILFHEIGHAITRRLSAHTNGQALFDAYVANLVYGGRYRSSTYSAAMLEVYGPESARFINEAFAEDFRLFIIKPDAIPDKRRKYFEEILRGLFPMLDFLQLRHEIRTAHRTTYGSDPVSVHGPATCETVRSWRRKTEVDGYYNENT